MPVVAKLLPMNVSSGTEKLVHCSTTADTREVNKHAVARNAHDTAASDKQREARQAANAGNGRGQQQTWVNGASHFFVLRDVEAVADVPQIRERNGRLQTRYQLASVL